MESMAHKITLVKDFAPGAMALRQLAQRLVRPLQAQASTCQLRSISHSTVGHQAQPELVEYPTVTEAQPAWLRELGTIRNDWRYVAAPRSYKCNDCPSAEGHLAVKQPFTCSILRKQSQVAPDDMPN